MYLRQTETQKNYSLCRSSSVAVTNVLCARSWLITLQWLAWLTQLYFPHLRHHRVRRENPCFANVECTEIGPNSNTAASAADGKRYVCGSCPEQFAGGNGETCYHDNPCLKPAGVEGGHKCVNARCIHNVGGYECECEKGFTKSSRDPHLCEGSSMFYCCCYCCCR